MLLSQTFQTVSITELCTVCVVTLDIVRKKLMFQKLVPGSKHGHELLGFRSDGSGAAGE